MCKWCSWNKPGKGLGRFAHMKAISLLYSYCLRKTPVKWAWSSYRVQGCDSCNQWGRALSTNEPHGREWAESSLKWVIWRKMVQRWFTRSQQNQWKQMTSVPREAQPWWAEETGLPHRAPSGGRGDKLLVVEVPSWVGWGSSSFWGSCSFSIKDLCGQGIHLPKDTNALECVMWDDLSRRLHSWHQIKSWESF